MSTKTQEALKMAIEALETNVPYYVLDRGYAPLIACKKALEQPTMTYEQGFDHGYEAHRVEQALEQPAQAITEGSQLSNIKAGSQSEKPSPPPAPKHTCTYSRTMNQEYPRKCIHCGEVEALAQPAQEPVAKYVTIDGLKYPAMVEVMAIHDDDGVQTEDNCDCINAFLPQGTKLYTHPAPSWQGLSDGEILDKAAQIMVERHYKDKNK